MGFLDSASLQQTHLNQLTGEVETAAALAGAIHSVRDGASCARTEVLTIKCLQ